MFNYFVMAIATNISLFKFSSFILKTTLENTKGKFSNHNIN
jgi:hypothetical protein